MCAAEFTCIGCKNCTAVCDKTFTIEEDYGRARVMNQACATNDRKQEAIETCPVSPPSLGLSLMYNHHPAAIQARVPGACCRLELQPVGQRHVAVWGVSGLRTLAGGRAISSPWCCLSPTSAATEHAGAALHEQTTSPAYWFLS